MPNGHESKEYGKHRYANYDGPSDCEFDCGCWKGPTRSGGPIGLDPSEDCPNNPKDGKLLGGDKDYDYVVTKQIQDLNTRLYKAEDHLKQMSLSKTKLVNELASVKEELFNKNQLLAKLQSLIRTSTGHPTRREVH